jgi:hypothetical protein
MDVLVVFVEAGACTIGQTAAVRAAEPMDVQNQGINGRRRALDGPAQAAPRWHAVRGEYLGQRFEVLVWEYGEAWHLLKARWLASHPFSPMAARQPRADRSVAPSQQFGMAAAAPESGLNASALLPRRQVS